MIVMFMMMNMLLSHVNDDHNVEDVTLDFMEAAQP